MGVVFTPMSTRSVCLLTGCIIRQDTIEIYRNLAKLQLFKKEVEII